MYYSISRYCPTKDKTVSLTVDYINDRYLEDTCKTPYSKGRLKSCSACNGSACNSCTPYNELADKLQM